MPVTIDGLRLPALHPNRVTGDPRRGGNSVRSTLATLATSEMQVRGIRRSVFFARPWIIVSLQCLSRAFRRFHLTRCHAASHCFSSRSCCVSWAWASRPSPNERQLLSSCTVSCSVYRVWHRVSHRVLSLNPLLYCSVPMPCIKFVTYYVCHVFGMHALRMLFTTHYLIAYVIIHVFGVLRMSFVTCIRCYYHALRISLFPMSRITYIMYDVCHELRFLVLLTFEGNKKMLKNGLLMVNPLLFPRDVPPRCHWTGNDETKCTNFRSTFRCSSPCLRSIGSGGATTAGSGVTTPSPCPSSTLCYPRGEPASKP